MNAIVVHRGRMCVHANKAFRAMRDEITSSAMRLSADARCPSHLMEYDDHGKPRRIERAVVSKSLPNILRIIQDRGCSDPRDRIFGVLGLVSWLHHDPPVLADYSLSRLEVATRSVRQLDFVMGSLHSLDVRLLLSTLDLSTSDPEFQELAASRRLVYPPQASHALETVHKKAMSDLWEFAAVDCEERLIPHDGSAPLDQNIILDPGRNLREGDIAVDSISGHQFILRQSENDQWIIIGISRSLSGIQRTQNVREMKTFSIYMGAEDLLVWYYLQLNFDQELALGGRVRVCDFPGASYAVEEPPSYSDSDEVIEADFPISDPDIF